MFLPRAAHRWRKILPQPTVTEKGTGAPQKKAERPSRIIHFERNFLFDDMTALEVAAADFQLADGARQLGLRGEVLLP